MLHFSQQLVFCWVDFVNIKKDWSCWQFALTVVLEIRYSSCSIMVVFDILNYALIVICGIMEKALLDTAVHVLYITTLSRSQGCSWILQKLGFTTITHHFFHMIFDRGMGRSLGFWRGEVDVVNMLSFFLLLVNWCIHEPS